MRRRIGARAVPYQRLAERTRRKGIAHTFALSAAVERVVYPRITTYHHFFTRATGRPADVPALVRPPSISITAGLLQRPAFSPLTQEVSHDHAR